MKRMNVFISYRHMVYFICLFFILLLAPAAVLAINSEPSLVTTTLDITYEQSTAREMLRLINEFRTGDQAYYLDEDNTSIIKVPGLSELTYSKELEEIAMQRAAELAIVYSHTRPNGSSCDSLESSNGIKIYGENIAAASWDSYNYEEVFISWREDDEDYAGQGHRRNMLRNYTQIGIGHATYNGASFWVQEFGYDNDGAGTAYNGTKPVSIEISNQMITFVSEVVCEPDQIFLSAGQSQSVPLLFVTMNITSGFPYSEKTVPVIPVWKSDDTAVAKISDGKITGIANGNTTISSEIYGLDISVNVNVGVVPTPTPVVPTAAPTQDGAAYNDEQVVLLLRENLKKYNTNFTITYITDKVLGLDSLQYYFDRALEHTGGPDEGDYLRYNLLADKCNWHLGKSINSYGTYYSLEYNIVYIQTAAEEAEVSSAIQAVFASISPKENTEIAKIRAVYDYVVGHIHYLASGASNKDYSTYAAIINSRATNQGFATLMYRLLLMYGIDNRIANSSMYDEDCYGMIHRWNYVGYGNAYYFIDASYAVYQNEADLYFMRGNNVVRMGLDDNGRYIISKDCDARLSGYNISDYDYNYVPPTATPVPEFIFEINAEGVLTKYNGEAENVVIPENVKAIGDRVFSGKTFIKTVVLPKGLTSIGNYAFNDCIGLTECELPEGLLSIKNGAFLNCTNLKKVQLPKTVTSLGSAVFQFSGLTEIILSEKLTAIPEQAFYGCKELPSVTIPSGVTSIGNSAFQGCNNLLEVKLFSGLLSVGRQAFCNCLKLNDLTIPDTVTAIGNSAFENTDLAVVTIPKGVSSFGSYAFAGCKNLSEVIFEYGPDSIGEYSFYLCESLSKITIPESVTSIGQHAFDKCSVLTDITIPPSVTWIDDYAVPASVTIHTIEKTTAANWGISNGNPVVYDYQPDEFEKFEIDANGVLTKYSGTAANVIIPDNVRKIGELAFQDCLYIKKVLMPDSVTAIGNNAFLNCANMTEIKLSERLVSIGINAFLGCNSLTELTIPESVTLIDKAAFYFCSSLVSIKLPSGLTSIGKETFYRCSKLENIIIPDRVTSIGADAFYKCDALTDITIPPSVTSIVSGAIPAAAAIHTSVGSYAANWGNSNGNKVITDYVLPVTPTPIPTKTPVKPTNTPAPTATPRPTATPVPAGPSVTSFGIWRIEDGKYTDVTKQTLTVDISVGEKLVLQALAPNYAKPVITWKNSSAKAANLSVSGDMVTLTGIKAGTTKITASYKDGKKTVKAVVTVKFAAKVQPGSLFISGSDTVAEKKTVKLTVKFNQPVQPTNNKVTWVSENKKIASVSSAGVVKGLQQGDVRITACSKEQTNICDSVVIHVKPITKTVRIIDQDNGQLQIDLGTKGFSYEKTEYKLSAEALSSTGSKKELAQEFDWKSSNVSVATVENGVVKGIKSGKVTITAAAKDGSKKSAKVNIKVVSNLHGKLTVEFISEKQIRKGGAEYPQFTLEAVIDQTHQPDNNKVKWTAEDSTLLSVNTKGIVTPKLTNRVANYRGYSSVKACLAAYPDVCDSFTFIFHDTDDGFYIDPYFGKDTSAESLLLQDAGGNYYFNSDETGNGLGTETSEDSGSETSVLTDNDLDENVNKPEISDTDGNENFVNEDPDPQFGENVDGQEDTVGTSPHFASNEIWMTAGESLILDVLDADGEAVIVGLHGDTDAVLWNEELHMLTAVGEAEVTAFLSTIDPVEIKDMMAIHIISEIPEEEEVSEETGEAEGAVIEENENVVIESAEPAEGENTSEVAESVEGGEIIETGELAEGEGSADTENVTEDAADDETREVSENQKGENIEPEAEETPAAEPVEIRIRDLGEYDVLSGEENGVTVIDRERFELDDETLSGLVFEIENESVAKLTAQSVEELLAGGIEIQLLTEGETRLLIKQEGEAEPLREIRLVVTAAPVVEEEPAEEELSDFVTLLETGNDGEEDQNLLEFGEEFFPDEIIS